PAQARSAEAGPGLFFHPRIQYAIIRIGSIEGQRGIESDSGDEKTNLDLLPRSAPVLANITILGNPGATDSESSAALHREAIEPQVWRSVFTDDTASGGTFDVGCLDIDDVLRDGLAYVDGVFNCSGGDSNGLVEDSE
ncbi:MAG: hypothetical protein AAFX94_16805, partial [Myxococcota bacterium]